VTNKALAEYLDYLAHERGLSSLTRENYARDIRNLLAISGDIALNEITPAHIRRFIATLHGKNLGSKSIARMLSSWRGFFSFLGMRHGLANNPCVGMKAPKAARSLPQALSIEQASKLVDLQDESLLGIRDQAILELFYSSGLRLAELVGLDIHALNFTEGTVTVTGKGNKTRIVPMGEHAIAAIKKWLAIRSNIKADPDHVHAVFITERGKRITPRAIQYRLKQWAIKQDISSDIHPHMLRHSFASHVLQSSGDLRAVQEMLGHANISTTQIYTHLDFQHLAKVYDAAHPRARKK
jgi:integrase/recombinase XerC